MPARRYVVFPQGGGPLTYASATLPAATIGLPYSQPTAPFVGAGVPPYSPFALNSQTVNDGATMSAGGIISMTPAVPRVRITNTGAFRVTNLGNLRQTT